MPERVRFLSHGKDAVHPTRPEDFHPVNHIVDTNEMIVGNEQDNVVKFDVPKVNRFIQGNDWMPPKEVI